jgi:hypothetical protein
LGPRGDLEEQGHLVGLLSALAAVISALGLHGWRVYLAPTLLGAGLTIGLVSMVAEKRSDRAQMEIQGEESSARRAAPSANDRRYVSSLKRVEARR